MPDLTMRSTTSNNLGTILDAHQMTVADYHFY